MLKVKIKASGKHAQEIVGQMPNLGEVRPKVKLDLGRGTKPVPSRKGNR
jgi:hypothetical protein